MPDYFELGLPKPCTHIVKAGELKKKFNFFLCDAKAKDNCPKDKGLDEPACALDLANSFGNEIALQKLYHETIAHIGYAIRSVEWRIVWLNNISWLVNIEGEDKKATHDLLRITRRCKIIPLEFETSPKSDKKFCQRGSSWGKCPLERFFSSLDDRVFPIEIPVKPESLCGQLVLKNL